MNFISTGDFYDDFHLQTSDIPINRRRRRFAKYPISCKVSNLVGLVGYALEFLGRIGLGLVFGCMSSVDIICKYVRVTSRQVFCLRPYKMSERATTTQQQRRRRKRQTASKTPAASAAAAAAYASMDA